MIRLIPIFMLLVAGLLVGAPRAMAADSESVVLFMLQVVATGDLDSEALPIEPALVEAWENASPSERTELRDVLRPLVEEALVQLPCDGFVSLAEAGFVEATHAHVARYQDCIAEPVDTEESVAEAPQPPPSATATRQPTESPTAAYQRASAGLAASHNMYVSMSNTLLQNHVGNMNAILNMGNNNYRYEYVSKP